MGQNVKLIANMDWCKSIRNYKQSEHINRLKGEKNESWFSSKVLLTRCFLQMVLLGLVLIPKSKQNRRTRSTWLVGGISWKRNTYTLTLMSPTWHLIIQWLVTLSESCLVVVCVTLHRNLPWSSYYTLSS